MKFTVMVNFAMQAVFGHHINMSFGEREMEKEENIMASELTGEEIKWLKRLKKALRECPSDRLGFYTIGDEAVFVYDKSFDAEINEIVDAGKDFCTAVYDLDADLDCILFPSNVHSTAG